MFSYNSSDGNTWEDNKLIAIGYSGHEQGINNPLLEDICCIGPIPRGLWEMLPAIKHPKLGPCAIPLRPLPGTNTFGRTAFYVHGDEVTHAGEHKASDGCIIENLITRKRMNASTNRQLRVI